MAKLWGQTWTEAQCLARVGRMEQLAGCRRFVFDDGPARGMRGIDVRTGSGLAFTVLPDRGMDIGEATFRGMPLAWLSPTGYVRPERYEPKGTGWLRTFGGGLMTTCGYRHFGAPEEEGGRTWPLHGRASHLAASDVRVRPLWTGDTYHLTITAAMIQAEVFQPTLELTRKITAELGSCEIRVADRLVNRGDSPTTAMMLYHLNLGWPLVAEGSRLLVDAVSVEPRDAEAAEGAERHAMMEPPTAGWAEKVYHIEPKADEDGRCRVAMVNPEIEGGLGVAISWPKAAMPYLTQWKQMGQGVYVCGVEPCNAPLLARGELRDRGLMPELAPGESLETQLAFRVHAGAGEVGDLEKRIGST